MAVLPFPLGLLPGGLWHVLTDVARLWQEREPVLQHGGVHAELEPCLLPHLQVRTALIQL